MQTWTVISMQFNSIQFKGFIGMEFCQSINKLSLIHITHYLFVLMDEPTQS